MRTIIHIVFFTLIIFPSISLAQNLPDSLLTTFYNKALLDFFSDTIVNQDQAKFGCILVKTDFDASKLIKNVGKNKFKFFNSKTKEQTVLGESLKKNKDRSIYWINHEAFGPDTVDINIGGWTIVSVNKHNLSLGAWCGGTMGYVPDFRFIRKKATNTWVFLTAPDIWKQQPLGQTKRDSNQNIRFDINVEDFDSSSKIFKVYCTLYNYKEDTVYFLSNTCDGLNQSLQCDTAKFSHSSYACNTNNNCVKKISPKGKLEFTSHFYDRKKSKTIKVGFDIHFVNKPFDLEKIKWAEIHPEKEEDKNIIWANTQQIK